MKPKPIKPKPGQESVWDYPRPPRVEPAVKRIQVIHSGVILADTARAYRVLETASAPVYYIPPEDIEMVYLEQTQRATMCEWKGQANYFDVRIGDRLVVNSAWAYSHPTPQFVVIKDHLAFYAQKMDCCLVGGEQVRPQPGEFYGGWVTNEIVGPIKGAPGTGHW